MRWPEDPNTKRFAINVRIRLVELGMTQKALTNKIGMYDVWLSRRLTGEYNITRTDAALIACALGTTADALYGDRDNETVVPTSTRLAGTT